MRSPRRNRALRSIGPALLLTSIAACSSPAPVAPAPKGANACDAVPLRTYPPAVEQQAAAELRAAPPGAAWPGMITDYGRLRAGVRACQATK